MFQKLFALYKKSTEWDMGMQYAFDVYLRTTVMILHRKKNEYSCYNYDSIIHCICKVPLFISHLGKTQLHHFKKCAISYPIIAILQN